MPALAAWTAFLLCRRLTRSSWASLAGGYLFGFSTYVLAAELTHIFSAAVFLVPVAALLVRPVRRRRSSRPRARPRGWASCSPRRCCSRRSSSSRSRWRSPPASSSRSCSCRWSRPRLRAPRPSPRRPPMPWRRCSPLPSSTSSSAAGGPRRARRRSSPTSRTSSSRRWRRSAAGGAATSRALAGEQRRARHLPRRAAARGRRALRLAAAAQPAGRFLLAGFLLAVFCSLGSLADGERPRGSTLPWMPPRSAGRSSGT